MPLLIHHVNNALLNLMYFLSVSTSEESSCDITNSTITADCVMPCADIIRSKKTPECALPFLKDCMHVSRC